MKEKLYDAVEEAPSPESKSYLIFCSNDFNK